MRILFLAAAVAISTHPTFASERGERDSKVRRSEPLAASSSQNLAPLDADGPELADNGTDLLPSSDDSLTLRNEDGDEAIHDRRAVWAFAESPDGKHWASSGADDHVRVWSAADGALVKKIHIEDASNLFGASWSFDGQVQAHSWHSVRTPPNAEPTEKGDFNRVRRFDLQSPKRDLEIADATSEIVLPGAYGSVPITTADGSEAFTASVARLAKGRYVGGFIRFYDAQGRTVSEIDDSQLIGLSGTLALAGAPFAAHKEAKLTLWDLSDLRRPREITPAWMRTWFAKPSRVDSLGRPRARMALVPYLGRTVVFHSSGRVIRFLDLETGKTLSSWVIPKSLVLYSMAVDPDGRRLAALVGPRGAFAGPVPDVHLAVWDLSGGRLERFEKNVDDESRLLLFIEGGRRLVVAGNAKTRVLALSPSR